MGNKKNIKPKRQTNTHPRNPTPKASAALIGAADTWKHDAEVTACAHHQRDKEERKNMEKTRLTDKIIAVATVVIAAVAIFQWSEMHTGGVDTHDLAKAAVASSRAWVAPEQMTLGTPLESGLPLKYQIRIVNPGKEPALGVVWNTAPSGVPYIHEGIAQDINTLKANSTCSGLEPAKTNGLVLYPTGPTNSWVPLSVQDTPANRQLVDEVLKKTKSLVIEGCFAYITGGAKHTSSFRFFLRDISDKPSFVIDKDGNPTPAWSFNVTLNGSDAD